MQGVCANQTESGDNIMVMGMFFWVKKVVPFLIVATDGSGDYTTISAALSALPATGGHIYIKPGTYTQTVAIGTTKDNVTISGAGESTIIETSGDIAAFICIGTEAFVFENIYCKGGGAGAGVNNRGLNLQQCHRAIVRGCKFTDFEEEGVRDVDCDHTRIYDNLFKDNDVGVEIDTSSDRAIITNNHFINSATEDIFDRGTNTQVGHNTTE